MNLRYPSIFRIATRVVGFLMLCLCVACATGPLPPKDDAAVELDWPDRPEAADDVSIYRVDPEASELRVVVAPAGSLARLGHHHVIGGPVWRGEFRVGERAFADLRIDVQALEIDRPAWRQDERFDSIDPSAIEGTRRNLLGPKVLDAENHPLIEIRSVDRVGPAWQADVTARIRVRGRISEWRVPVSVEQSGDRLVVRGALDVDQSALGLEPFSAAGGALRVAERMRVRFRIVATAVGS
jgi:polyisoprenoid-binding protein YceI